MDFIHLATGISINPSLISVIDFSKPAVMVFVGGSAITAEGEDAVKLRELFGREALDEAEGEEGGEGGTDGDPDGAPTAKRKRRR